ncbi:MAG: ThiF family adenylyltransferase [Candidatus Promineifilaceae bacterium]|nr:ThiF family adenylyltransferase [Candidatus Promineifilaceae bacterium]
MTNVYLHEIIYRGPEAVEALGQTQITLCGAGALGSLLADNLARQGVRQLTVIDFDRIEQHNAGTQLYGQADVGAKKVDVLKARLFRSVGIEMTGYDRRLDERNVNKYLRGADLVVDTFDNSASRRIVTDFCRSQQVECVHLGMNADYGEVRWNNGYRVPQDVVEGDVCDYPLARNLILMLVAVGCELIVRYTLQGTKENVTITLRDLKISVEPF